MAAPAPAQTGCCQNLTSKNYIRLAFGGASLVCLIFASAAMGAPVWTQGSVDFGFFGEFTVTWSLWRQNVDRDPGGDDDNSLRKNDLDSNKTWRAVQFNRAATVLAFLFTLFATIYYFATGGCFVSGIADIIIGSFAVVMAVFAWAGAGSWSTAFAKNEIDDWDDETPCAAGCGLEAFNGILYAFLGVSMIVAGVANLMAPRETPQPVATQEPPPIVAASTVVVTTAAAEPAPNDKV